MRTRYIAPPSGGTVQMEVSSELAQLMYGMLGTIAAKDLLRLDQAKEVRLEISDLYADFSRIFGSGGPWKERGRLLRFGQEILP